MTVASRQMGTVNSKLERPVQWYPGHMVQTTRRIREYLRIVDIVVEVIDARIPRSGRNPILDELIGHRTRVVALDRDDLADPGTTQAWLKEFSRSGFSALAVNARVTRSSTRLARAVSRASNDRRTKTVSRAMIVGLPNSGKSSILNALLRRAAAKTENRAGVTRQLQWFRLDPKVELMDTPGVLPPKIATAQAQWKLAMCGAVPQNRYDPVEVASSFHSWLVERNPGTLVPDLQSFAERRGHVMRGGEPDYHNAAQSYIREFNDGLFGRISLEAPDDAKAA
jgi:ribosome biogenesis GTPase A